MAYLVLTKESLTVSWRHWGPFQLKSVMLFHLYNSVFRWSLSRGKETVNTEGADILYITSMLEKICHNDFQINKKVGRA